MGERRWEDLNQDCLVQVFQKVGLESLISGVSFVCRSWYKATSHPDLWKVLDFLGFPSHCPDEYDERLNDKLVELVVNRSRGAAIRVLLPENCSSKAFDHIADGCPALRYLNIPYSYSNWRVHKREERIAELICKWKGLEVLSLGYVGNSFDRILAQISIHCHNFVRLNIYGYFNGDKASAIVKYLPKLKCLSLKGSKIHNNSVKHILAGCEELELLDVSLCEGIDRYDDEILQLASRIKTIDFTGAHYCPDNFYDDE